MPDHDHYIACLDLSGRDCLVVGGGKVGHEKVSEGGEWTKRDLLHANRVKLELFRRFGVLPGAGDRHLVEFFAGFLTEESEWGERWGVGLTSIEDRERDQAGHIRDFEQLAAMTEVDDLPSGEMVAPVMMCLLENLPGWFPLNIPNHGQVADVVDDAVVESMCVVDGSGVRGRDVVHVPPVLADTLRRVSTAQELTVDAALTGDRELVFEAMMVDPLAGRLDYDALRDLTDEMLVATKRWLPQFA